MLPLSAEFKRSIAYRITDQGRMALHLAGMSGSPARSKRTPEQQLVEFRVLDYLAERESVREASLRGATRVRKALLSGMVRKKWIAREDVSAARDAARTGEGRGAAGGRRGRRLRLRWTGERPVPT
jgi:primosomal protein N' (replication factor Y) (superfamily II helicase)